MVGGTGGGDAGISACGRVVPGEAVGPAHLGSALPGSLASAGVREAVLVAVGPGAPQGTPVRRAAGGTGV